jgi:ubiquinone/menaquinone biosynthesis C-methylase UbiE
MSAAGGERADPLTNPKDYWSNRVAGWSDDTPEGLPADDTFDRALIGAAAIVPGMNVLDLAAGGGDPTISIAAHLAGNGSVTAFDITYDRLVKARSRAENLAFTHVRIVSGDMTALPFPDDCFDAVTSRNGLMFPDDKVACVAEARRVLKPGGMSAWLVWSTIEDNPLNLTVLEGLRCQFKEEFAPRMIRHVLGEEGALSVLLTEAGFRDVTERRFVYERITKSGDGFLRQAAARAMPQRAATLSDAEWKPILAVIEHASARLRDGDVFRIPLVARLATGTAPS